MANDLVLTIYSIPGISCVDEPIFPNLGAQRNYFSNQANAEVLHAYFPPYFTNVIKVDVADLPDDIFDSNYNYLSIEYNSKTYYYFISEITYVNESIVAIRMDLDDIQTYMFEATIISGLIERMSIKRYTTKTVDNVTYTVINRSYIRENLSLGVFNLKEVKMYNSVKDFGVSHANVQTDYYTGCFIVKSRKHTSEGVVPDHEDVTYHLSSPVRPLPYQGVSGYNTAIIPMSQGKLVREGKIGAYDSSLVDTNYVTTLMHFALNDAEAIYIYYLPFASAGDIAFTASDTCRYDNDSFDLIEATSGCYYLTPKNGSVYDLTTYIDSYTFPEFAFARNTSRNVDFDYKYVPYLLDEQYISVTFGENTKQSSFPLYKLLKPEIYLKYVGEPNSGARVYWITVPNIIYLDATIINNNASYNFIIDDYLGTFVVGTDKVLFDLSTSAYVNWLAYNKASIPLDFLGSMLRAL